MLEYLLRTTPWGLIMSKATVSVSNDDRSFLDTLPESSGVYQMYDNKENMLYIGKAKNLKKRIASYYAKTKTIKTQVLVNKISDIEIIITENETEAFLLEQTLIKKNKPVYNILLKDDKSYPYILLTKKDKWPRLSFFRGKKKDGHQYFGPYPGVQSVKETLSILQKIFKIRQCTDVFFKNRSRPCLQYQINRCKAPCVNNVSEEEYMADVGYTERFLFGNDDELITLLVKKMDQASEKLLFEEAAEIREQIKHLRHIQIKQSVVGNKKGVASVDIIGFFEQYSVACLTVIFVRYGEIVDKKKFIIKNMLVKSKEELLTEFIGRFYVGYHEKRQFPVEIIVPFILKDTQIMSHAISNLAKKKVVIKHSKHSDRGGWLSLAYKNAESEVFGYLLSKKRRGEEYAELSRILNTGKITGMECFDISHNMGEKTIASCVVFDENGPVKKYYRRFNITGVKKSDDYGAMAFALKKRYENVNSLQSKLPSLVLIDGGKGQLKVAEKTLQAIGFKVPVMAIAKGQDRRPGEETMHYLGKEFSAMQMSRCFLLIRHIRDEAHRFALEGHRHNLQKSRKISSLEQIPGVGKARKMILLKYYGGIQGLRSATPHEMAKVKGISLDLAKKVHEYLQRLL